MRILDKKKIPYQTHEYSHEGGVDGLSVAEKLGQDPQKLFKTLVTQGADKNFYVFVIPVDHELDLKLAAKSANVKSVAMIAVADINKVTGYIRGGCSPIGMKKQYKTIFHITALSLETVYVSGGKIGTQIEINPKDLIKCTNALTSDITTK
ncbi:MAG: Cys-tRNA(Pro) deacylase [Clostridia bacterium]